MAIRFTSLSYRIADHDVCCDKNSDELGIEIGAVSIAEPNRNYRQCQCKADPMVEGAFVGHERLRVPRVALQP